MKSRKMSLGRVKSGEPTSPRSKRVEGVATAAVSPPNGGLGLSKDLTPMGCHRSIFLSTSWERCGEGSMRSQLLQRRALWYCVAWMQTHHC